MRATSSMQQSQAPEPSGTSARHRNSNRAFPALGPSNRNPSPTSAWRIAVRGGFEIEGSVLERERLPLLVEGAAAGKLRRRSDDLTIDVKGAGLLSAGDLKAKRAKVSVQGAGQVTVNASDELDAEMS